MMGGMSAGATSGALSGGGFRPILQGAVIGGVLGSIGGGLYKAFGDIGVYVMLGAGAGYAGVSGGWNGLAYYAGGVLGGIAGASIVPGSAAGGNGNGYEIIRSDESTGIKVIFHPQGSTLYNDALNDAFVDNTISMYGHSNESEFAGMDANKLADFVRNLPEGYSEHPMSIALNGCRAGAGANSIAQQLAVELNTFVNAPNERYWGWPISGRIYGVAYEFPSGLPILGGRAIPNYFGGSGSRLTFFPQPLWGN